MTVGTVERIIDYAGDGSAVARTVPFYFLAADDLRVTRVNADASEDVLVRGVDYNVAGAGDPAGGSVTPTAPIANGTSWIIEGAMPLEQPIDYTAGDDFPAESHERGLDRAMIALQEQDRRLADGEARSLRVPRGETAPELGSFAGDQDGMGVGFVAGKLVPIPNDAAAGAELLAGAQAAFDATAAQVDADAATVLTDKNLTFAARDAAVAAQSGSQTALAAVLVAKGDVDTAVLAQTGLARRYTSTGLGIAGTTNGQHFYVLDGSNNYVEYLNNAGVAAATGYVLTGKASLDALVAAAQAAMSADVVARLPAKVKHFYPMDEGTGTSLRDVIGGATATCAPLAGGTITWDKDGNLVCQGAYFKLPAMLHRCVIPVYHMEEAATGYIMCGGSNSYAVGVGFGNSAASFPDYHVLSGQGIHSLLRRGDAGGTFPVELNMGAWTMIAPVQAANNSGTIVLGAGSQAGGSPASKIKFAGLYVLDDVPNFAELRRILTFEAARQARRGNYVEHTLPPKKAKLVIGCGESNMVGASYASFDISSLDGNRMTVTNLRLGGPVAGNYLSSAVFPQINGVKILPFGTPATTAAGVTAATTGTGGSGTYAVDTAFNPAIVPGTIFTNGLPTEVMAMQWPYGFMKAYNNAGASATGGKMTRFSLDYASRNHNPPSDWTNGVPRNGPEVGFFKSLHAKGIDKEVHFLKTANGSTFLAPGGSIGGGTVTTSYQAGSFTGTLVGNTLTVAGLTGVIPIGWTIEGSGLTTRTISADLTGNGGAGTYSVSGSPQTIGPIAMTASRPIAATVSRNPDQIVGQGMRSLLEARCYYRMEAAARNAGIGYDGVVWMDSDSGNDIFAMTVSALGQWQAWLEAKRTDRQNISGISNVYEVMSHFHMPNNSPYPGSITAGDPDYPNNPVGAARLNIQINYIRPDLIAYQAAHSTTCSIFEHNGRPTNSTADQHLSVAGNGGGYIGGGYGYGGDYETRARAFWDNPIIPLN
jgi:hypothetical protein